MLDSLFKIVFLIGFIAGSVIRKIYTRRRRRDESFERRHTVADTLVLALSGVGLIVLPLLYVFSSWLDFADYDMPAPASHAAGWTGAVVFAAALWLLWHAHVDLGQHWSPTVEVHVDHTLVTEGVYRHIRHPMYAAHFLWGIAQALLLQNWITGPALLVVFGPFCFVRVPREEQMMIDHFGDAYRDYIRRTGCMLPMLRRRVEEAPTDDQ